MPAAHGQRLAALLPNVRRYVDDAYVLAMLDQTEQTAKELQAFLTS